MDIKNNMNRICVHNKSLQHYDIYVNVNDTT